MNKTCDYCSLMFECYSLKNELNVIQVACRWIDENIDVHNVILGCKLYAPIPGVNDLSLYIKEILLPYDNIVKKTVSIITQCSGDLTRSIQILLEENYFLQNVTTVVCFADCLDISLNSILFNRSMENADSSTIFLYNLREIVSLFQNNPEIVHEWTEILNKPILLLCKNERWIPFYQTLEVIDSNWDEFSALMKKITPTTLWQSFFYEESHELIRDVINVIYPLIEIVNTISNEKILPPLCSMYPYLKTCSSLYLDENTSAHIKPQTALGIQLKDVIQKTFALPWNQTPNENILVGCILDPEYNNNEVEVFKPDEKKYIQAHLLQELSTIISPELDKKNEKKIKKFPIHESIFDDLEYYRKMIKNQDTTDKNPEDILSSYQSCQVSFDDNYTLYDWWKENNDNYKELSILFRKFCCLPSTASSRGELFAPEPLPFYVKRNRLNISIAECCIMIRSNMDYIDRERYNWPDILL